MRKSPALLLALAVLLLAAAGSRGTPPPAAQPASATAGAPGSAPATTPASSPRTPVAFAPGVRLDWSRRAVLVDSHVVLRRGALEFLACLAGKEHESILRIDAAAIHVYTALGLIGLLPGRPPQWDETRGGYASPAGDLVTVTCEWAEAGRPRAADAFEWLLEIEYARPALPRPWVFAGSVLLPDGTLAADRSGVGLALVDFSDSLLALSRGHSSRTEELWVAARSEAIPPAGTGVQLVFQAATPRDLRITCDFRGELYLDGRFAPLPDVADQLRLARQLEPQRVQPIACGPLLQADRRRLRRALADCGVPPESVRLTDE
jgi:hypothetical protein